MTFFIICVTLGWVLLLFALLRWPKNISSACTGNCRQGRNCDCMEKKNEKIN
jgi:hypothetical protein